MKLLRTTFNDLIPIGAINPFSNVPTKATETIFRKPYSPEELAAILEAARTDEFIRPIIILGMCTAMRRGGLLFTREDEGGFEEPIHFCQNRQDGTSGEHPNFSTAL